MPASPAVRQVESRKSEVQGTSHHPGALGATPPRAGGEPKMYRVVSRHAFYSSLTVSFLTLIGPPLNWSPIRPASVFLASLMWAVVTPFILTMISAPLAVISKVFHLPPAL